MHCGREAAISPTLCRLARSSLRVAVFPCVNGPAINPSLSHMRPRQVAASPATSPSLVPDVQTSDISPSRRVGVPVPWGGARHRLTSCTGPRVGRSQSRGSCAARGAARAPSWGRTRLGSAVEGQTAPLAWNRCRCQAAATWGASGLGFRAPRAGDVGHTRQSSRSMPRWQTDGQ